jgi:hypothetical protein
MIRGVTMHDLLRVQRMKRMSSRIEQQTKQMSRRMEHQTSKKIRKTCFVFM